MDVRRSGIVVCAALSAAVLWVAGPGASLAGAATGGGECQLQGVANITPPPSSNSGSCGNSTTTGESLATWGDGLHTVVSYNTTGALAAVQLQGTVVASMTLALVASSVPASCTAPASFTIASDEPTFAVGQQSLAALTFSPTTQDQNCVTMGVSSANISGTVGIGSAQ